MTPPSFEGQGGFIVGHYILIVIALRNALTHSRQAMTDLPQHYKDIPQTTGYLSKHSRIKMGKQNRFKALLSLAKPGLAPFTLAMSSIDTIWQEKKNRVDFVLQQAAIMNDGRPAIFGTLTVDGYLHSTTFKKGGHFATDRQIKTAHRVLVKFQKVLRKALHRDLGTKADYFYVVEPHKDMTPHVHFLLFIDESDKAQFFNTFNRVLRLERAKKSGIGHPKYQVMKFIQADETSSPTNYIAKYITKMIYSDDTTKTDKEALDGYYRKFKIRQFTYSNIPISASVRSTISTFTKDLDLKGLGYQNLADWALKNVDVVRITNRVYGKKTLWIKKRIKNEVENPKLIIQITNKATETLQGVKISLMSKVALLPDGEILSDSRDWIIRKLNWSDIGMCQQQQICPHIANQEETKFSILDYIYNKCPLPIQNAIKKVGEFIQNWKNLFHPPPNPA